MKIPEKIMIGAVEVKIVKCSRREALGYSGSSNAGFCLIMICEDDDYPDTKKDQTFFHELVHQILDHTGYESGDGGPYDETFVSTVSLLLHQVVLQIIEAQNEPPKRSTADLLLNR